MSADRKRRSTLINTCALIFCAAVIGMAAFVWWLNVWMKTTFVESRPLCWLGETYAVRGEMKSEASRLFEAGHPLGNHPRQARQEGSIFWVRRDHWLLDEQEFLGLTRSMTGNVHPFEIEMDCRRFTALAYLPGTVQLDSYPSEFVRSILRMLTYRDDL